MSPEPARVAVVADGVTHLYEMNGSGLVEIATVRGALRAEQAALLIANLAEFLSATVAPPKPKASPVKKTRAPTTSKHKTGSKPSKGPGIQAVYDWIVAEDRPVTRAEIQEFMGPKAARQDVGNRTRVLVSKRLIIQNPDGTFTARPT